MSAPLLAFAKSIAEARRQFVPGDCSSWLAFYEAKQFASGELLRAQPEVRAIDDQELLAIRAKHTRCAVPAHT